MPMWSKTRRVQLGLIALVVTFYVAILFRNLHESERRSLQLQAEAQAGDQVRLSIRVLDMDPNNSEMTARISFRLVGSIARDEVTPTVDLKLYLNSVRGPQEFEFPRGRRLNPIVAVFSTDGNVNRYPFDHHQAYIRMLMTRPTRPPAVQPAGEEKGKKKKKEESAPGFADLTVGAAALQRSEPLAISPALSASIPGLKFEGSTLPARGEGPTVIELRLRRADNVIVVSVLVMTLMMALAMSVLLMAAKAVTSNEKLDLLPLSLSITLLFGLPALRDAQPGVPALGAFGDYVSFLWAEQLIAASAVIIIWVWLRPRRPKAEGAE